MCGLGQSPQGSPHPGVMGMACVMPLCRPDSGQGLNYPSLRLPLWSPHCPASVCTTRLQSQSPHQPTWSLSDSCFHSHNRQLRLGGVASSAHVQGWPVAEPGLEPLSHSPSPSRCTTLRACPCSSFPGGHREHLCSLREGQGWGFCSSDSGVLTWGEGRGEGPLPASQASLQRFSSAGNHLAMINTHSCERRQIKRHR